MPNSELPVRAGQNESVYAACELQFVKIDEQSDRNIKQFEVAHKLRLMYGQHLGDRLGLNQNAVFDQNIETERFFPKNPL